MKKDRQLNKKCIYFLADLFGLKYQSDLLTLITVQFDESMLC